MTKLSEKQYENSSSRFPLCYQSGWDKETHWLVDYERGFALAHHDPSHGWSSLSHQKWVLGRGWNIKQAVTEGEAAAILFSLST